MVAFAMDGVFSRIEGAVLFSLVCLYVFVLVRQSKRPGASVPEDDVEIPTYSWDAHLGVQMGLVLAGLALLVLGAGWLVDAAVSVARLFGVSELARDMALGGLFDAGVPPEWDFLYESATAEGAEPFENGPPSRAAGQALAAREARLLEAGVRPSDSATSRPGI